MADFDIKFESTSDESSEEVPLTGLDRFRTNIVKKPDSDLKLHFLSDFSLALADLGILGSDLKKFFQIREQADTLNYKLPSRVKEMEEFMEFLDQLAARSPEERMALQDNVSKENASILAEVQEMLHARGCKGTYIIDNAKGVIYTSSSVVSSFFRRYHGELNYPKQMRNNIRYLLRDFEKAFGTADDTIRTLVSGNNFLVAAVDLFFNAKIEYNLVLKNEKVTNGALKSSQTLPFIIPQVASTNVRQVSKIVVSQAIQDLTGCTPVSESKSASCSPDIMKYTASFYDSNTQTWVPRDYYYPIVHAPFGYYGDYLTSDLLTRYKNKTTRTDLDSTKYFEVKGSDDLGNCNDSPYGENLLMEYPDEGTHYSDERAVWEKVIEDKKIIKYLDMRLINFSYSPMTFPDFSEKPKLAVVSIATYREVASKKPGILKNFAFFLICASSQLMLAVPIKMLVEPYAALAVSNTLENRLSNVQYIPVWKGLAVVLPRLCSTFYAVCVMTFHLKGDLLPRREVAKNLFIKMISSKKKGKKSKLKDRVSVDTADAVFADFWASQVMPRVEERILVSALKSTATTLAFDALSAINEMDMGDDIIDTKTVYEDEYGDEESIDLDFSRYSDHQDPPDDDYGNDDSEEVFDPPEGDVKTDDLHNDND